ncbi:hypothetical protein SAMN05216480_11447 [Pustulibacterium marinum]|uniref:Outer membrane protein beta-barrel domain-containing protein n=1 Tax=Pustulibacterium marinum TaxID=1224947 RepID=A0A1I7IAS2_9FLAO|nr:hypothetical protein [Pustulibacterium marinum]SFU70052.1 hypothetical protein SAMN05216480_11447 [Pustulibacterium marinum]
MKKYYLILILSFITYFNYAQDASVESSTFGIQTGLLGVWAHNEFKLTNTLALRSEVGFDSAIWGGHFYDGVGFVMAPVLTLEPRWYYNIKKRFAKSKTIDGNSANFLSIKTSYHPDWFVISNEDNVSVESDLSVIPTWGIRRGIGRHFTYETGIGVGYQYVFEQPSQFKSAESNVIFNIHVRIGYRF